MAGRGQSPGGASFSDLGLEGSDDLIDVWAGLLASGSFDSPRLPVLSTVAVAAFVPGYSGGTATDSHRLPYSPAEHASAGTHVVP
jgi:hypothetical protein